ncbi:hypothetical protein DFJ63DRAFT_333565 [Scheffersomyces coipomensis]|uniref:uncharacterized protein n=1 Tax=Scheffersomyces coipomensis TaxID=1788519 RepID=UPI00315DC95B
MSKYPEPSKLKDRYSPVKKIPPYKERNDNSKNYEAFAVAPGRGGLLKNGKSSGVLSVTDKDNIESVPSARASKVDSKIPQPNRFSPIKRSGSPIRRQKISEIEHEAIQTKDKEVLEEINKRAKTVSFTSDTQFNNSSTSLFVHSRSSSMRSDSGSSNTLSEDQFLYVIGRINEIQSTQKQILQKLENLDQKLA